MDKQLEIECLANLSEGDHRSYELLFLAYHPKVFHFLCGFIKNEEEAYDMAQEIFYKVWVNRVSMAEVRSFKAYLFSMARHMIYNHYEHNLVKEKYTLDQLAQSETYEPEQNLFAKDLSFLIDLVVSQMPEQRQRVFTMSRKEGFSSDEIALRLKIHKRTVENHISNALSDLRRALQYVSFLLF
ncbi:RNA polymerase sigma-70 factor [Proteiniphilum saccharofermentans]|uniref:RNA polymerase sigma-70 factor n=1 Tax=Proteiniphilum saccharofermentans TaxID=1642647 RepID=UPI0028AEF2E6|nr:RNA polymerase sigma-70 factor [Proteiniphilum saccharofermentans]